MKKILTSAFISSLFIPVISFAQTAAANQISKQGVDNLGEFVNAITTSVVGALATLFLAGAVAAFFFGIVQYILGAREGTEAKIKAGNQFMLWGLIAIFVMFSVWGIVRYAQRILRIEGINDIVIPNVKFNTGSTEPKPTTTGATTGGNGSGPTTGGTTGGGGSSPTTGGTTGGGGATDGSVQLNGSCTTASACSTGTFCYPTDGVNVANGGRCIANDSSVN
jgi:uncharacterized membrane protein YgcG